MGVIAKGIPRGVQGLFTPVSLGYPQSVFNKNSTLKGCSKNTKCENENEESQRYKRRGMVGDDRRDDDLNVDQYQTETQYNL